MADHLTLALRGIEKSGAGPDLARIRRGLEKESLRVSPDGVLSQQPHPQNLGAALTHPWITTDYSESLLEFITPVHESSEQMLEFLNRLHVFTYQNIGSEILWTNSMPCILEGDESIPIADYGKSNIGFMKHVYRRGLGYRYGRLMQTIAGIHYNFSLPDSFFASWLGEDSQDLRSEQYLRLLRNFHRHCWLLLYLFGAAPAVCRTFLEGREHDLDELSYHSYYLKEGTTLRMSDLGYQNSAQDSIRVCTNNLDNYVKTLRDATEQSWQPYEDIGVCVDGDYRQLNTNLLQIENEYYTVIRPKRSIQPMEKPSSALRDRGIEYIEVRIVDLNPFLPLGIDAGTIKFLDVFLMTCLLKESPEIPPQEDQEITFNRNQAVHHGRGGNARIMSQGQEKSFREQATDLMDDIQQVAEFMDRFHTDGYADQVAIEREKLINPEATPSARIIDEIRRNDESYFDFAMRHAVEHGEQFRSQTLSSEHLDVLESTAKNSLRDFQEGQRDRSESFDHFLNRYFNEIRD